jgi:hypothetical protein
MRRHVLDPSLLRARWAAFGAAVAVAIGGGGLAIAHAATADQPAALFHAISPVRVFDTREGTGGVSKAVLGADSQIDVVVGGIPAVPANATSVVLNVTVVDGTASSFLTVWPTGATRSTVSSLNWDSAKAIPNAVTVALGTGGKVSFYNHVGTVNVLADVAGYYTGAGLGTGTQTAAAASGAQCTVGQVMLTASKSHAAGGMPANGQILQIADNVALFTLLGTTYGGNGTTTFALPDMRSVAPDGMTYSICIFGVFPALA